LCFVACALVTLGQAGHGRRLGAAHAACRHGARRSAFLGIVFFSWFCNAAMHIGMADLSVLQVRQEAERGLGERVGHVSRPLRGLDLCGPAAHLLGAPARRGSDRWARIPGTMVNDAVGWAGLICVIIAGWTTANPTIYRAGLAFQG
jgi:nucleobase:cation symporter-1, NCS1 family